MRVEHVLDEVTLDRMRREMRGAEGDPATVLGSTAQQRVTSSARKATQVAVSGPTRGVVVDLLAELRPRIEAHFAQPVTGFEEPQFLRYGAGDYFVAHQDGNTPLVRDDSRFRRVSVVLFVNAQSEHPTPGTFGGGVLVLYEGFARDEPAVTLTPAPGRLVAFPAETTHEVLPITRGERLSVVSWYRG
jgi:SM-20-related protein